MHHVGTGQSEETKLWAMAITLQHLRLFRPRELHDAINQYHAALAMSLARLIQEPENNVELSAQSVELLDQRILTMQTLVRDVASHFFN
jgi:hypothetical protein